jgi:hypothetical protein
MKLTTALLSFLLAYTGCISSPEDAATSAVTGDAPCVNPGVGDIDCYAGNCLSNGGQNLCAVCGGSLGASSGDVVNGVNGQAYTCGWGFGHWTGDLGIGGWGYFWKQGDTVIDDTVHCPLGWLDGGRRYAITVRPVGQGTVLRGNNGLTYKCILGPKNLGHYYWEEQ